MNKILRDIFTEAIGRKTDSEFQEFVSSLYSVIYGQRFVAVKQKRGKGADGILNNNTILAGYGPGSPTLRDFKKKISADYKSFSENWKDEYPDWQVVYNGDFTASMIQFLDTLHPGVEKVGLRQLVELIAEQNWSKIREIGGLFGIPPEYYMNDLLAEVINDLLNTDDGDVPSASREKALYIEDKIAINYSHDDIATATEDYFGALEYFATLEAIFKEYSDIEVSALRSRIQRECSQYGGTFKERFDAQTSNYSTRVSRSSKDSMVAISSEHFCNFLRACSSFTLPTRC